MTWPSFFAASINAGVTGSGGGAAATTRVENAAPASSTPVPLSMPRRDNLAFFIGASPYLFSYLRNASVLTHRPQYGIRQQACKQQQPRIAVGFKDAQAQRG